jgi:4-hydroxy-tetrahydrodipicolinate synthase
MLTPFSEDGAIDEAGLDALIDWYLGHGAGGLFTCCQSSEIAHLGWEERYWLASHVVRRVGGRVPVVATGTLGLDDPAGEAACLRRCADTGVDAVVVITGQVVPVTADDAEAVERLEALAAAAPGPALGLYECPRPYKRLLSPAGLGLLAASGRWRYCKETSCAPAVTAAKVQACAGTPLAVFDACMAQVDSSLAAGAAGCSPILANLVPDLVARLCTTRDPRLQAALAELGRLVELGYPHAVKTAIADETGIGDRCRQASSPGPAGHADTLRRAADALRCDWRLP